MVETVFEITRLVADNIQQYEKWTGNVFPDVKVGDKLTIDVPSVPPQPYFWIGGARVVSGSFDFHPTDAGLMIVDATRHGNPLYNNKFMLHNPDGTDCILKPYVAPSPIPDVITNVINTDIVLVLVVVAVVVLLLWWMMKK